MLKNILTTSKFYGMDKTNNCPVCGKNATKEYTPFCSKRCADIDLGKWFMGSYAVPAVENDEIPPDEDEIPPEEQH